MMPRRIPSLDGLRAISIGLVIVGHAYQSATNPSPSTPFWLIVGNAGLGVEIFFVISGFLITKLLVEEQNLTGDISLRNFYVRRFFRIVPAFWAYLAVVLLLAADGLVGGVTRGAFLSSLAFVTNYSPWFDSAALAHTWSLSVEEQFYVLWPAVLLLVLARSGRVGATWIAIVLIVLAPLFRVLTHLTEIPYLAHRLYYMLHTRVDSLMFGCLLALVCDTKGFERFYQIARLWVLPGALFTVIISPLMTARFGGAYIYTAGLLVEGASIALVLIWLVRNPNSLAGCFVNARPIVHMGRISYSLYLWQELMLKTDVPVAGNTLLALLCLIGAAEPSYYLIERPFLRLRRAFIK